MASEKKGYLRVPVWVDDGVVKVLVDDNGRVPIQLAGSGITLEVDVTGTTLAANAATAPNQATLITALQSVQNLVGALHDVGLDELDVNLKTSDITLGVTESSPLTSIQSQLYGWDLTYWRKNPIVWGYTDIYAEYEEGNNVSPGDRTLTFSTVGAGEVWVVTCFVAWCVQANPSRVDFYHSDGTTLRQVGSRAYPTALLSVDSVAPLYLDVDSYLLVVFRDCVLNDDIRASAFGYKMKVNEM